MAKTQKNQGGKTTLSTRGGSGKSGKPGGSK
jgi:hypothetical protein